MRSLMRRGPFDSFHSFGSTAVSERIPLTRDRRSLNWPVATVAR